MSKPADISQSAWDAADVTFELERYGDGRLYLMDARIKIARTIHDAVMKERSEILAEVMKMHSEAWGMIEEQAALEHVSQAIHNRTTEQS